MPVMVSCQVLEEIVVTARKREESLQSIPISVTAFTQEEFEQRGITNLQDIGDYTPGLDFAQAFGRKDFRPSIRGQSNILGRPNVGLYIDGVIVEEGAASIPLSALERIEVIKGPQSALYGRSTLAGAINYVLKKPGDEFEGEVFTEYGEDNQLRANIHLSGPISEQLGAAVTLSHYQRNGTYSNRFAGNGLGAQAVNDDVGGEETNSITAVLKFNPHYRLNITGHVSYEDSNDDQFAIALQNSSANNCFRVGVDTDSTGNTLTQPTAPVATATAGARLVNSAAYNGSGYYCGEIEVDDVLAANGGDTNLETNFYNNPGIETQSLRLDLRTDFDINDSLTLTSISGYNKVDTESRADQTFGGGDTTFPVLGVGSPFFVQGFGAPATIEKRVGFVIDERDDFQDFSQELRLSYDNNGRLHTMLGLYYYSSEKNNAEIKSSDTSSLNSIDGISSFVPFAFPPRPAVISTSAAYEGAPLVDQGTLDIENWSIFGSIDFDISEKLNLGFEARYNKDSFNFARPANTGNVKGSFSAFLPKLIVSFQATDQLLLYGNIGKGNKPGGVNTQQGLVGSDQTFGEETAWSFEAGIKSLWLDNTLRVNLTAYHINWRDLQLTNIRTAVVNGQTRGFTILENVGKANVTGVELELTYDVTDYWNVFLAYSLADSEIEEFVYSVDSGATASSTFRESALIYGYSPNGDVVISGTQLPHSSKHQLNLSNTFQGNINDDWSWFLRADYLYNSKRYAQVYNLAHTGNRNIINLRSGLRSGKLDIELWVNNVMDDDTPTALTRYIQENSLTFNPFNRAIAVTLPEGRQVGVTTRYRF